MIRLLLCSLSLSTSVIRQNLIKFILKQFKKQLYPAAHKYSLQSLYVEENISLF